MDPYIKDVVKNSSLYKFYLDHPENELLERLMNRQFAADANEQCNIYKALNICYKELIRNDLNIIYEIVPIIKENTRRYDPKKQVLTKLSIRLNDMEIISRLKDIFLYTIVRKKNPSNSNCSLEYAYEKHGLELIKSMSELIDISYLLGYAIDTKDENLLNYLFDTISEEKIICEATSLIAFSDKSKIMMVFEACINRIDLVAQQNKIFVELKHREPSIIKMVLEYGLSITSNKPLYEACSVYNLDLIEFYLQYGLTVDVTLLESVLFRIHHTLDILKIFVKYNVDFSMFKFEHSENNLFAEMENLGLDKNALLCRFLK